MSELQGLGRRIALEQDMQRTRSAGLAEVRADVRERIAGYDPRAARARRLRYAGGAAAVLAAAAAVLMLWPGAHGPALELRAGASSEPVLPGAWVEAPAHDTATVAERRLRFSDGTRLDMAPRTRVRVIDIDDRGAHLLLESGRVHVAVVPRAHASWRISMGPFTVRVVGTEFDVAWDPDDDAFSLALTHGEVALSGCVFGSDYRVRVGHVVEASCQRGLLHLRKLGTPAPAPATTLEPQVAPQPNPVQEPEPEVVRALEPAPKRAPAPAPPRASSKERAEKSAPVDPASQEEQELLLIRRRHAGSPRAAVAAFALGRLEFDKRHAHAKAAQWFGTYLKEDPKGSLAREARGRLMEATLAAGDRTRARSLAEEYLSLHPTGPHAELARSLVASP